MIPLFFIVSKFEIFKITENSDFFFVRIIVDYFNIDHKDLPKFFWGKFRTFLARSWRFEFGTPQFPISEPDFVQLCPRSEYFASPLPSTLISIIPEMRSPDEENHNCYSSWMSSNLPLIFAALILYMKSMYEKKNNKNRKNNYNFFFFFYYQKKKGYIKHTFLIFPCIW